MPIYEYECGKCGTFEATQKITDRALTRCPTCKGKVKKLISNTSFQLKGTGWYVTDYARKGSVAEKVEKELSSSDSGSSSDDKPKKKSPAKKTGSDKS